MADIRGISILTYAKAGLKWGGGANFQLSYCGAQPSDRCAKLFALEDNRQAAPPVPSVTITASERKRIGGSGAEK